MILEVAILDVIPGQESDFRRSFAEAQKIISSMPGYISHELKHCIEKSSRYILLVNWETLEDHWYVVEIAGTRDRAGLSLRGRGPEA